MTEDKEPVCAYGPGSPLMDRWRSREQKPLLVLRCGRGKRRCRRGLVELYEAPGGALVRFYKSGPDMPLRLSPDALEAMAHRDPEEPGGIKSRSHEQGTALMRGQRDRAGFLVALEDDDYWHDIVHPGCQQHGPSEPMTRGTLMEWVRRARRGENLTDATV